jgi:methionyl aminopeptidase
MVADVLALMREMVRPGVTTGELNEAAGERMRELGGKPSFLGYMGYPANICVSVENEVVHGIPGRCRYKGRLTPDKVLTAGQVISIDCGVIHDGFHGDSAVTLPVGEVAPEVAYLLETCRQGLWAGIEQVRPGAKVSDVARAIEARIRARQTRETGAFGIVEEYVGHGIGQNLHEAPQIPNYVSRSLRRNDVTFEPGMVVAIEPMVNAGSRHCKTLRDGWTVVTRDGGRSAHFEHTIAVVEDGYEVFTRREDGSTTH